MTFELFLLVATVAYVIQFTILIIGIQKTSPVENKEQSSLFISVIIAARDEENNLSRCLDSVIRQTYPSSLMEIIVVNDGSVDGTKNIIEKYATKYSFLKLIETNSSSSLRGKANALSCGIDAAKGDIILITDADCSVPETWVEKTAKLYSPNVGLIGGFCLQKATSPFSGMQSLDWAYVLGLGTAAAHYGVSLGSIGNNLSFRKSAYDQVGGYRKLKFSVTEDYTIVQAIIKTNKWKYVYPLDPAHVVESEPCQDVQTLLRQKQRWGKGGLDMKLIGFALGLIGYIMHLSPFIMLYWNGVVQAATAMMIKFIIDYIYLYQILHRLEKKDELRWFYWFELYMTIYVLLLPWLVFFGGKIKWKGREY